MYRHIRTRCKYAMTGMKKVCCLDNPGNNNTLHFWEKNTEIYKIWRWSTSSCSFASTTYINDPQKVVEQNNSCVFKFFCFLLFFSPSGLFSCFFRTAAIFAIYFVLPNSHVCSECGLFYSGPKTIKARMHAFWDKGPQKNAVSCLCFPESCLEVWCVPNNLYVRSLARSAV
jgi:hypothetical protein